MSNNYRNVNQTTASFVILFAFASPTFTLGDSNMERHDYEYQKKVDLTEWCDSGNQTGTYSLSELERNNDESKFMAIQNVAMNIIQNSKEVEPEISKIIEEKFWDIYEPF